MNGRSECLEFTACLFAVIRLRIGWKYYCSARGVGYQRFLMNVRRITLQVTESTLEAVEKGKVLTI